MRRSFSLRQIVGMHTFWVVLSFVLAVVIFSLTVDGFLSAGNFLTSARNFSFIALIALGATIVIMSGGIDLSVGSIMGLAGVVCASAMQFGCPAPLGIAFGLAAGVACGFVNGALIAYLKLSPFVVTLGMLSIARSLAVVVSDNKTLFQLGPDHENFLAIGSMRGTPLVALVVTGLLISLATRKAPWGNYVRAIGGNEEAAHRSGVSVEVVKISVYVLSGFLAALSGILMVSWLGSVSSSLGTGYELTVVAATVIGGTQLTGGAGSLLGASVGAALLETIRNGLTLSGINPYWQGTFVGACIILAVAIDAVKREMSFGVKAWGLLRRRYVVGGIAAAAITVVWFMAAGSSSPVSDEKTRVFAVVPKFMNHPFFEQAKQGCEQAASELTGVECLFIGPSEPSEQVQIQILQDLVTRGVEGIAVAPANSSAAGRALTLARDAGIPVVTWDSDLIEADRSSRTTYIGTENYKLGEELGKLLIKYSPSGGTYALISGGAAAENLNERMKGIRDSLAGKGFREVSGTPLYCNDDSALAVQQLEDILGKYPDLNAVISVGAWPLAVQGAYKLIAEKYKARIDSKALVILSADTLPMQLDIVRAGQAHGLVGQRPFQMGHSVMFALNDIVQGKKVADPIYTGLDVCVRENLDHCLSK